MSEEKKMKKPFLDPNGLYRMKNTIGALYVLVGMPFAITLGISFLVILFFGFISSETALELSRKLFERLGSLNLDVGFAILIGSIIISGAILLSGIRKE